MTPVQVDVTLPAGWLPLGPVPGALLAAAAPATDGRAAATLVLRVQHCPGLVDRADADAVIGAVGDTCDHGDHGPNAARRTFWCSPETLAVAAACAAPGFDVGADALRAALDQIAVYAVESAGTAISPSSAGEASAG